MRNYYQSLLYAVEGVQKAFETERNFKLFTFLYLVSLILAAFFEVSTRDWEIVIFTGGVFLAFELVNTALENFADAFDTHTKSQSDAHTAAIKATKDIAAGASLLCALAWGAMMLIVFIPYIWVRFSA